MEQAKYVSLSDVKDKISEFFEVELPNKMSGKRTMKVAYTTNTIEATMKKLDEIPVTEEFDRGGLIMAKMLRYKITTMEDFDVENGAEGTGYCKACSQMIGFIDELIELREREENELQI